MRNLQKRNRQGGFTLIEVMVSLTVITLMSLMAMGALGPWMGFKASIDSDRKLQDIKQGLKAYYDANAMAIEAQAAGQLGPFVTSSLAATGDCVSQATAFQSISAKFSESAQTVSVDGYKNPFCFMVSGPLSETRDGAVIYYRNVAVVSTGGDARLDAATQLDAAGNLITGGDDLGVVVSGFDVQFTKYQEAMRRMGRAVTMYETYFTTRYLATADRDISRYYFAAGPSNAYDNAGSVATTNGNWAAVATTLAPIGVAGDDAISPWEQSNNIEVSNLGTGLEATPVAGARARTPDSVGTAVQPYTAVFRTRLPAPAGVTNWAIKVAIGNY